MDYTNKEIKLTNQHGTVILKAETSLTVGISERADRFYESIADSFTRYAREVLYREAEKANNNSSDRRKRYRFVPLRATLCCKLCGEGEVDVLAVWQDTVILHERHLWKEGLLEKRRRVKII